MGDNSRLQRSVLVSGGDGSMRSAISAALEADGWSVGRDLATASAGLTALAHMAGRLDLSFTDTSASDYADAVNRELETAFFTLQQSVEAIRATGGGGAIVLAASAAGTGRAFDTLQQGLRLLVKSAALELGAEGIRVNYLQAGAGENPLGQACSPQDVAAAVRFLLSDRAHFMTGADLILDGGAMAA